MRPVAGPLLAAVVVLAGCASPASPSAPATTAAPATAPATAPAASQTVSLGGTPVPVTVLGSGSPLVLLSNQSDQDHTSWNAYASTLTSAGYRVALWDYADGSGLDPSQQVSAVAAALAADHPSALVLVGASKGAKASLIAAAHHPEGIAAVVSLSAEASSPPAYVVATEAGALRLPVLLVTASEDAYGSAQAGPSIMAALPGTDKKLVTVPGSDHGTALLSGASAGAVVPAVQEFLSRVAPAR